MARAASARLTVAFVAFVAALMIVAVGCEPKQQKKEHAAGSAAEVRVVSLSPSTTEAMFAVGAGELLVGRSRFCDFPEAVTALPSVGGFADPNMEAILALRPTMVIGSQGPAGPALEERLRGQGLATAFDATDSIDQIGMMMRALGDRFDRKIAASAAVVALDKRVARIEKWGNVQSSAGKPVTVVMVFDAKPVFVAGPGSFADELIRKAGATNAIKAGGKWPTIDVERLLKLDPDVIVDAMNVGHGGASKLGEATGWDTLRAVKEGRVRRLTSAVALRPGPRIADGLAGVARAIFGKAPPP